MHYRVVLAAAVISLSSATAFAADPIGIEACDDFLTKYQACVDTRVPASQKEMLQKGVDMVRSGWLEALKSVAREDVENICKTAPAQMKPTFDAYGCAL
jgi:hypothetical protein